MASRRTVLLALLAGACTRPRRFSVARASERLTVLPLAFVEHLPVVSVEVEGKKVDVLLDLGGFDTLSLAREIVEAVGKPTGRVRRFRNARGDTLTAREFAVSTVKLGDVVLRDVRGYEHVYAAGFVPPVKTGYLGRGILHDFAVVVDYPARQLMVSTQRSALRAGPGKRWQVVGFSEPDYGAVIPAVVDGESVQLLLDTGATSSFLKPSAVPRKGARPYRARGVTIAGISLGALDFEVFDLELPNVDGFLGANFFAQHRVLIDFKANECALEIV